MRTGLSQQNLSLTMAPCRFAEHVFCEVEAWRRRGRVSQTILDRNVRFFMHGIFNTGNVEYVRGGSELIPLSCAFIVFLRLPQFIRSVLKNVRYPPGFYINVHNSVYSV